MLVKYKSESNFIFFQILKALKTMLVKYKCNEWNFTRDKNFDFKNNAC